MAKKKIESSIMSRLMAESKFSTFSAGGTVVSLEISKEGTADSDTLVDINGVRVPMNRLLHAAEILRHAIKGAKCVCVFHGIYSPVSFGCQECVAEAVGHVNSHRDELVEENEG